MNAAEFQRKRGRIDGDSKLSDSVKAKLLRRLTVDARARRIFHGENGFLGWRLPSGEMVCKKQRFHALEAAEIFMRSLVDFTGRLPKRAYYCSNCKGFHLTSQERNLFEQTLHA